MLVNLRENRRMFRDLLVLLESLGKYTRTSVYGAADAMNYWTTFFFGRFGILWIIALMMMTWLMVFRQ